jgi:quercetin dioxygenase-like cupin family protein
MVEGRHATNIQSAEVVLPPGELGETLSFFIDRLGFRLEAIWPADRPSGAVVEGHGLRIRLDPAGVAHPGVLRLLCREPSTVASGATDLTAPNGTRLVLQAADPLSVRAPLEPAFVLSRNGEGSAWSDGRAGMRYRDLIPGRQGGRFIASQIRIPAGGPVADYVHFHRVRFQMIYCAKGWVRVVYEDQGPPFVLPAGDCVLQPPEIRHRVLESSPGLEVIEITSPAEHETVIEHELALPTPDPRPERSFSGQRFVRHDATSATWDRWRLGGFECRDTGIGAATDGLAGARVVRACGAAEPTPQRHDGELLFAYILSGRATLDCDGHGPHVLAEGDSFVVPAGAEYTLSECSSGLEFLDVTLPA